MSALYTLVLPAVSNMKYFAVRKLFAFLAAGVCHRTVHKAVNELRDGVSVAECVDGIVADPTQLAVVHCY